MKFEFTCVLPASLVEVEQALLDEGLPARLAQSVDGYRAVEELSRSEQEGALARRVRFVPSIDLPAFAKAKIEPEMLEWVEESRYDRARHSREFRIRPNLPERWQERFSAQGTDTLVAQPDGTTRRAVTGELAIKVTLIGGMAERLAIGQLRKNFDQEANLLRSLTASRKG